MPSDTPGRASALAARALLGLGMAAFAVGQTVLAR